MVHEEDYAGKYLQNERPSLWHKAVGTLNTFFNIPSAIVSRNVQFADVSFYQSTIDWAKYATKAKAVIIRAGQNTWPDSQFVRNWAEAKKYGLKRGAYWFYDDRVSPTGQANLFAKMIGSDRPEMELFVDYEKVYGGPYQGLGQVVTMMKTVEGLLPGTRVGMYTGYYFFNGKAESKYFDYLSQKPLWEAWYVSDPAYVKIPAAWSKLTHWQFGTPTWGKDWGVQSLQIDMNWHNGTVTEFNYRYGAVVVDPPPVEPPPVEPPPVEPPPVEPPIEGGKMIAYTNGVRITTTTEYGYFTRIIEVPYTAIDRATFWTWGDCRLVENIGGDIVFNFCEFSYSTCQPISGLRIGGQTKKDWQTTAAPFFGWQANNYAMINHPKTLFNSVPTASQGFRYILEKGLKNPHSLGNAAWNNREPRRLLGTRNSGETVIISVSGRDSVGDGITLHEAVEIGKKLNLYMLIDGDSGSPTQDVVRFADGKASLFSIPKRAGAAVFGIIKLKVPLTPAGVQPPVDPPPVNPPPIPDDGFDWTQVSVDVTHDGETRTFEDTSDV